MPFTTCSEWHRRLSCPVSAKWISIFVLEEPLQETRTIFGGSKDRAFVQATSTSDYLMAADLTNSDPHGADPPHTVRLAGVDSSRVIDALTVWRGYRHIQSGTIAISLTRTRARIRRRTDRQGSLRTVCFASPHSHGPSAFQFSAE